MASSADLAPILADLTQIKVAIATQSSDLKYILAQVSCLEGLETRLRAVEGMQREHTTCLSKTDKLETRLRDLEIEQAGDRTRRNIQDGISAALAVIAGALGIAIKQ